MLAGAHRGLRRAALAGLALSLGASAAGAANLEYAVKASYLSKFVSFIEWPAGAFASPGSSLNICVVGDDPFDGALDQAVIGRHIDGRPAAVRRLKRIGPGSGCHVLFVSGSRGQSIAEALHAVQGEPVLTVVDRGPSATGAVIQFEMVDNRVRFDIDVAAANANRIAISSKLLSLANSVGPGGANTNVLDAELQPLSGWPRAWAWLDSGAGSLPKI